MAIRINSALIALATMLWLFPYVSHGQMASIANSQPATDNRAEQSIPIRNSGEDDQRPQTANPTPNNNEIEENNKNQMKTQEILERKEQIEREKSDLKAQQEMALWSGLSFWVTVANVVLTGLALYTVIRTLSYTRKATEAANIMVEEAKKTTVAAEETVNVTRKIGQAQTRAYLSVEGGEYVVNQGGISGWISVKNCGDTPARNVQIEIFPSIGARNYGGSLMPSTPPAFNVESCISKRKIIQPNQISKFYFQWNRDDFKDRYQQLTDSRMVFYIDVKIKAKTIYDGIDENSNWKLSSEKGIVQHTTNSLIDKGELHLLW